MILNRNRWKILNGIEIPESLIELCLCETSKALIHSVAIHDYVDRVILPIVQGVIQNSVQLEVTSNHVHIGGAGLTPHNHLPHLMSSILFLTDADGELILQPGDNWVNIKPKAGRLVIIPATMYHQVYPSKVPGLRLSLVSNYGTP